MLDKLEDKKVLLGCILTSIVAYNTALRVRAWMRSRGGPLVPVGTIKSLYIYPAKSCKAKSVFSVFCDPKGAVSGERRDRFFQIIDGDTGHFYTARTKPQMVLIDVDVRDGRVFVKIPNGKEVEMEVDEIRKRNDVRKTTLHCKLRTDGLDCGDAVSSILSEYLEEKDVRMVMYSEGLFTERTCISSQSWWNNNPVPARVDDVAYADLAPYMIQTEGSLAALNSQLDQDAQVMQLNFRPVIVIDGCDEWDEDKWLDLQIGDVQLQCFKPCTRCIFTTINPETGKKHPGMQPLKKLREFRLAPSGPMRSEFKDSPIFGVNAGVDRPGYIHIGQVVYARYKKSAF